jgi:hypothetical protein
MPCSPLEIRRPAATDYANVLTPAALDALHAVARLDDDRQAVMRARVTRRWRPGPPAASASGSWIRRP